MTAAPKKPSADQQLAEIEAQTKAAQERQSQQREHQHYDNLAGLLAECADIVSNGRPLIRACLAAGMQEMLAPYQPAPIADARDAQIARLKIAHLQARIDELEAGQS